MAARRRPKKVPIVPQPARSFPSLLWFAVLLAAVFLTYRPVWHGGLLWDDEAHVIAESLRSWSGLVRLWTDFSVSQQYYPVTSTAFWLLEKVADGGTFAYHAANIVLHATSAFLVTLILRRLKIPGALVASAVFALHPVYVESVAWISELKNTLSGVCYLSALLWYLRFDDVRSSRTWGASLAFFALALGSKTVTATLPAAVLLILWWRRGRLERRRDVLPLLPFLALGVAAGLTTAWLEYHWVGARGAQFDLGPAERLLLAGRVVWFYAATLVWPANLMFNYPRWTIDAAVWWQYAYPIALLTVLGALFIIRHRTRSPLTAALFFIGTLFPVIGFFNVYPFRFSFVADHFQYLASLGLITALAAGLVLSVKRWMPRLREPLLAVVVALPLGLLAYEHSKQYVDAETLYRETIARNPASTLARGNLASRLLEGPPSGWPEAMDHARAAIAVDPNHVAAHNLLGLGLQRTGRLSESLQALERAVALDPGLAEAQFNLGLTLDGLGRLHDALAAYDRSLAIFPHDVKALHNSANVLRRLGRHDEAVTRIRKAITIDPDNADVRLNLADTLQAKGDLPQAIAAYQEALGRKPDWGEAWNNLGLALQRTDRLEEARQAFDRAVTLLPNSALVHTNLATVLMRMGRKSEAEQHLELAKRLR